MKKISAKISHRLATMLMLPVVAISAFLVDMGTAEAIPAFARQTSQPCTSCHSQHFPTLNSFGRMFKAQGYTMGGTQESVKGDGLDLPGVVNAAILANAAYVKSDGEKAIGFPAAVSLYFGGRIGENSGFIMEMPFEGAMDSAGGEVEAEGGAGFAQMGNLKWNSVFDFDGTNVGAHIYSTSMAGPAYGYELLSTGAMGMNVATTGQNAMGAIGLHMEHGATMMGQFMSEEVVAAAFEKAGMTPMMASMMAANMNMDMAGAATGFGVTAQTSEYFVYYSPFIATQSLDHIEEPSFANYIRAAWTPTIAGWNMGMGVQLYRGSYEYMDGGTLVSMDANASTLDFQAQGEIAGMATGIYLSYAVAPKSDSMSQMNVYNMAMDDDNTSFGMLVEMEVMRHLSGQLGYVSADYAGMTMMEMTTSTDMNGDSDTMDSFTARIKGTAITVGLDYLLAPNKRLGFKYVKFGGDLDTTVSELNLIVGF
ncbi:MAG TPA: hypothetical protein ENI97_03435 [Gammaproteobacteria bacterium]|nr:hypothetical protein [Gammaproteobacteria bacterium]